MTRRLFNPLLVVAAVMFAAAPILVARAPNEVTMGLVAKIVYFHVPVWFMMFLGVFICGIASGVYLYKIQAIGETQHFSQVHKMLLLK